MVSYFFQTLAKYMVLIQKISLAFLKNLQWLFLTSITFDPQLYVKADLSELLRLPCWTITYIQKFLTYSILHSMFEMTVVLFSSASCMTNMALNYGKFVSIFNWKPNFLMAQFWEIAIWNFFPKKSHHKKFSISFFWKSIWIHMIFD